MTRKTSIPISPAETEILRLVWEIKNATVQDVCEKLPENRNISYATVQTLLRRLEKKGYIEHRAKGKAHVFFSVAEQQDVIASAVGSFLDKLFGGDPVPLMQHLARHGEISADDIERLKKLTKNRS